MSQVLTTDDVIGRLKTLQEDGNMNAHSRLLLEQAIGHFEDLEGRLSAEKSIWPSDPRGNRYKGGNHAMACLAVELLDLKIANDRVLWLCAKCTREEFDHLLKHVMQWIIDNKEDAELWQLDYDRSADPGNRCRLTPKQALFLFLVLLKSNRTQDDLSVDFGIDQASVSRYLKRMLLILRDKLLTHMYMKEKLKELEDTEEIKDLIPGFDGTVLVDGTHVKIQRPEDDEMQKDAYSGKKKMHTYNTTVFTTSDGVILGASDAKPGSKSDITEFREVLPDMGIIAESMTDPDTPPDKQLTLKGDSGYQGVANDCPGADVIIPFKKPPGGKLTPDQKEHNRKLSSKRVVVEHVMGDLKEYRVLRGPFIGTPEEFNEIFNVITGLVNLRKMWSYLPPDLDSPT